jgi:tetraacyldisaccharide-1-P 4'-kinase
MWDKGHSAKSIRHLLDSPWRLRPLWFWILSPLFFLMAALWSGVAKFRRYRGYAPFLAGHRPLVLCCGNVSLGGTGKSPIVRALARDFLSAGFPVAIVTRGVGSASEDLLAVGIVRGSLLPGGTTLAAAHVVLPALLGDEAREHFELVRQAAVDVPLLVVQGRNRAAAIDAFRAFLEGRGVSPGRGVCLLDDGLQTFAAPRQMNLCVWDPHLLRAAPGWTPPVGPYRETGLLRFRDLLTMFDFRIWSRAPGWGELGDFKAVMRESLARWGVEVDVERDLFAFEEPWARAATVDSSGWKWAGAPGSVEESLGSLPSEISSLLLVHGIARGETFSRSVRRHLGANRAKSIHEIVLMDHAALTSETLAAIRASELVVCTAKDFFRWCDNRQFADAALGKRIVVCGVEVGLVRMDGSSCRVSMLINYQSTMREVRDAL